MPQESIASADSLETLFQNALSLQNEKKIDEALALYQKILDQGLAQNSSLTHEQASAVSQNMSLIYFLKKEPALSSIYNQKAVNLNPNNSMAIEFQKQNKKQFQTTLIPRDISFFENLNGMGLQYVSIEFLFLAVAVLLFFVLKNIFGHLLERKKADILNAEAPQFSIAKSVLIFFFMSCSILLFLKINDSQQLKAILKTSTVPVQVSAGENQAVVTQAEIGAVFNVIKLSNDADLTYVQIKYPGAYSGWLKRADLELLNSTHWPVFIDKK